MKIGIVISGGAAKSISSLGVLAALEELGLKPSLISGVSGGAIIAVFYGAGFPPSDQVDMVMEAGSKTYLKPTVRKGGFFTMSKAGARYEDYLGSKQFEDLDIPVTINAVDFRSGDIIYFSSGEIIRPLMGSTSIPGIFAPVKFKDYLLLDGAVGDNLPVSPLVGKCDFIIGVQTAGTKFNPNKYSVKSIAFRASQLMQYHNSLLRSDECDFLLQVEGLNDFGMFDFKKSKSLFKLGYDFAMKQSESLLQKIEAKNQKRN